MLSFRFVVIVSASVIASAFPTDSPAAEKRADAKLAAIQKAHKDAEAAFRTATESLEDSVDKREKHDALWKAFDKAQGDQYNAAVELAKGDPKADDAVAALEWVLTIPRSYYLPAGPAAMEEVTKHHTKNSKVGKLVSCVGYYTPHEKFYPKEAATAWAMIDAVAKDNPDKTVRAQAVLAKAAKVKEMHDDAVYLEQPDTEKLAAAAESAYEAVIQEYGDCPRLIGEKSGTVGEFAKEGLYELRLLRVGKVAPEIEAEGVDGTKFKLSDHRGKVVAVIFWASWCGPCMADVPHEREMTERLKGKPFTIVAVNGDEKREKAAEVMAREKMTWPSFWNGSDGADGPISKAWNVRGWPTVYILDAKGVIRFKGQRREKLEEKVKLLLEEGEASK